VATTIGDEIKDFMLSLTATSPIASALGDTFTFGTNLSVGIELNSTQCLIIMPTGGGPPSYEGDKYDSSVQIMLKTPNRQRGFSVMQTVINTLHNKKEVITKGRLWANQSTPIVLPIVREGGEQIIYVVNFNAKHVKF